MLEDIGPTLDGAIIATSHASHFEVAVSLLNEGIRRRRLAETDGRQGSDKTHRIVNILMEKPMTTDVNEAWRLWEMSTKGYPEGE
jgi:predicted dehydrogenase